MSTLDAGRLRRTFAWMLVWVLASAVACTRDSAPPAPTPVPTATPLRLVAVRDGVVRDPRTGLEWRSRDHEQSLPWDAADAWCRGLPADGGAEWRLPELSELESIYDPRFDEPCGDRVCHVDPAIRLGGPYVWTVTTRGVGTRFYYDVSAGFGYSPTVQPSLVRRTLCVRGAAKD